MLADFRFAFPVFVVLLAGALTTQDSSSAEPSAAEKEADWLQFYYQKPDPSRLVTEVKNWAADGTLQSENAIPVLVAFLSQVFRQNRDKIGDWYEQLSGLSNEEKKVIHTAMAFSRTTEADTIMRKRLGEDYDRQKESFPKILEMQLAQPSSLGSLWGFFYATGSEKAIRRIVWAFRFEDAPDNPDFAKVPQGHQPFYKLLPDGAAWTLKSNALLHPKVLEICKDLHANDKELIPVEKRRLGMVLNDVAAEERSTTEEPVEENP